VFVLESGFWVQIKAGLGAVERQQQTVSQMSETTQQQPGVPCVCRTGRDR